MILDLDTLYNVVADFWVVVHVIKIVFLFDFLGIGSGGGYFSLAQWQELELHSLIFRHFVAGAPVPSELLHLVKKSIIASSPPPPSYYFAHPYQQYPHYQQACKLFFFFFKSSF